jgi:hypothetical protein
VSPGPVILLFAALLLVPACANRGKKAAVPATPPAPKPTIAAVPPTPPPPLSDPQTRIELPPPQPINPAALPAENPSQDAQQPNTRPVAGPHRATPPPVTPPPAAAPAAPPPAAATEPPRGAIQEMISPQELKRLQDQIQGRRREVIQVLQQVSRRRLGPAQQNAVKNIRNFLALSDEAEKRNDVRQADALAERAQILARDLQNGK